MLVDKYSKEIMRKIATSTSVRFKDLMDVVGNPRTLSRKLKALVALDLVDVEGGIYKLSSRGVEAAEALERLSLILMDRPPVKNVERIPHAAYAPVIKRYCELLHQRYEGRLMGILLFGSIARGDWDHNSDIDLLIVVDDWADQPVWSRVRELQRVRQRLRETREYKTALEAGFTPIIQHYPLSLMEAKEFHRVYIDACIDGVILYDKDGFLEDTINTVRNTLAEMGARRIVIPGRGYYWVLKEVKLGEVFKL